ncbi:MAG: ADP-ribosylation factor-like protein [Candidatus Hermodarchaeota archaeon]
MLKVTLSLWDTGGQDRFDFFQTDFFKGVAALGLVFDVSRPNTFNKIDEYFHEIREISGNIPIFLIGNKNDLKQDVGETIPKEKIIQKINQYYLFEYIETSALENINVERLFYRLALTALLDFKPRLGEVIDSDHLRFKILLAGASAVGKSSLIRTFTKKSFEQDYKLTVGLDFMTQDIEISEEDIPKEALDYIKKGIRNYRRQIRRIRKREEITEIIETLKHAEEFDSIIDESFGETDKLKEPSPELSKKSLKKLLRYIILIIVILVILYIVLRFLF